MWDATRGRLVLYGGSTDVYSRGTVYNDTWIFDGTVWQQILGSTSPPPCSFYHKLAWHPASGDTVLFGGFCLSEGSTWVFGKSTWRTIASISTGPEPRWAHTLATEFGHGNVVLFGGFSLRGAGGVLGDTWTFDGNAWNAAPGPSPGSSGNTAQIRWDAKQHMPIMFGGFKAELATGTAAAWRFDGAAWQKVAAAAPPPDRSNFGMTWDAFHQRLVVFGGENDGRVALSDTWTLSGDTWTSAAGTSPSPRTGDQTLTESLLSWDGDRNKTVLFGGTGPNGVLGDTWTFDGQAWSEAVDPAQTSPPPRVAATFVYDPVRRRHILFGGRGIDGVLGDTWFFYLRGGSCTSGSQCGSGYCTDGVCCEARTCGVCQTCAGTSPGKCTVVLNAEDPDTCAIGHGKSCNAIGQCSGGPGVTCADGTTCGSGFCVDGVCCDSACNGACQACANTTKASGANAGHCEAAKAGSNPSSRCAGGAVCGETGSCITGASCSADGTQAVDAEGKNPTSCSPYKCAAGACPVMCASVDDCIAPAACTAAGHCELPSNDRGGGACSFAPERSRLPRSAAPAVLLFGFGATLARRRARSHRVRKKRSHAE